MRIEEKVKYESERDPEFALWARGITGGENIRRCIQCGTCSAACPLSSYMDYTPRQIINLAREGFKKEALSSYTIWLCASCYACRTQCPKEIKVTDVMYALKRRAVQENLYPSRFPTAVMSKEFARMVFHTGRVTENYLATLVFLKTNWFRFLGMTRLGLGLLRTGRMSFMPDTVKNRSEVKKILDALDEKK